MKIISLNTWGGRAGKEKLLEFFNLYKDKVDIFCLQEIWSAPYEHLEGSSAGGLRISHEHIMVHGLQELSELLTDFDCYFHPHYKDNYGLALFVKKSFKVDESGEVYVHKFKGFEPEGDIGLHARNVQYVKTIYNGRPLTICNFHGLWNGRGKTDSEDRLIQSENIVEFIQTQEGEIIFCGDLNLLPHTQSIKMLEEADLRNLITEYKITSTRSVFYTKPDKFADYIFVSSGITVSSFEVLPDQVSDHLALYVEVM